MNDDDDSNLESTSWLALTILDEDLDSAPDLADDLDTFLKATLDAVLDTDLELALDAVLGTDLEADLDADLDLADKTLAASPRSSRTSEAASGSASWPGDDTCTRTAPACDSGASVLGEEGRPLAIRRLVSAPSRTIQASSLARFLLFKAAAALVNNIPSQSEEKPSNYLS